MAAALSLAADFKTKAEKHHHIKEVLVYLSDECQRMAVNILESIDSDRLAFMAVEAENDDTKQSALTIALEQSLDGYSLSLMAHFVSF